MTGPKKVRAFTLIELLLVMVILAVLAAVAVPLYMHRAADSRRKATIAEISHIKTALATFEIDNSRFPTTAEGLDALVVAPPDLDRTWGGPYLEMVPLDKWGHPYVYTSPGNVDTTSFDLVSAGDDGVMGTEDDLDKYTTR